MIKKILIITAFMLGLTACDDVQNRSEEWQKQRESRMLYYECIDSGQSESFCEDYSLHG